MRKFLPLLILLCFCSYAQAQGYKGSPFDKRVAPSPASTPAPVEVASVNEAFTRRLARDAFHNPLYSQINSPYARRFFGSTLPATCTTYQTQVDSSTGQLNICTAANTWKAIGYLSGSTFTGAVTFAESAAPSGSAGNDLIWGDSTAHRLKMNNNNGGADTVVGAATTDSLTNKKLGSLTTNGPVFTSAGDGTLNSEAQTSKARGGTGADLSATGGAHFFLRQNSLGGAIDVVQPAASDLSNGTTGSNAVALADSPVFTTQITTPKALGGSAAGSTLILQSTSGTGTLTTAGVQIAGGTNGGTTIASFLNNGNVGVNTSSPVFDADSAGRYFSMDGGSSSFGDLGVGGNQSGTTAAIAEIGFFNSNLGTAEKRNAFITVRNDGATNSGKIQIGTANAGALSINLQIDHFGNFVAAGTAPTVASTGTGSSPTNTVDTGDNDFVGTITVTAGTAPSSSGTVTLTFAGTLGTNAPVCQWTLGNGTGTFNARATAINGTQSTSSSVVNWDNNAVNLTAASTYKFNYNCTGK